MDEAKAARKAQRKLERKNDKKRLRETETETIDDGDSKGKLVREESILAAEETLVTVDETLLPSAATKPKTKQKSTNGTAKVKRNMFIPINVDKSAINLTKDVIDDDNDVELVLIQVPSSMEARTALCEHGLGEKMKEILLSMPSSSGNSGSNMSSLTQTRISQFNLLSAPLRIEAMSASDGNLASQIRVVVQRESTPEEAGAGDEWEAALTPNAELVTKRATKMISVLHDIPLLNTSSAADVTSSTSLGSVVLQKRGLVPQFTHLKGRAKRTKAVS
jgi:hypothetical protein